MFRVLDELIGGTTDIARSVVNLMAILIVITVWAKTRKPGPTVAAIALGAFAIWGVHNFERIESLIDEQIDEADSRSERSTDEKRGADDEEGDEGGDEGDDERDEGEDGHDDGYDDGVP